MPQEDDDRYHHIEYIHFMISQLHETIKYADTKHAVGMTFVTSLLFASNEFLFKKVEHIPYFKYFIQLSLVFAFFALACGFLGIFPRFIAPYFARQYRITNPNIFYFKEIAAADTKSFKSVIEQTFLKSNLSPSYQLSGVMEIQALSVIAFRKLKMFELFMYLLFCYLVSICVLFWQVTVRNL